MGEAQEEFVQWIKQLLRLSESLLAQQRAEQSEGRLRSGKVLNSKGDFISVYSIWVIHSSSGQPNPNPSLFYL